MEKMRSLMVAVTFQDWKKGRKKVMLDGCILYFEICWSLYPQLEMQKIRPLMVAVARTNYPMPLTLVKLRKSAESRHFSKGQPTKRKGKKRKRK